MASRLPAEGESDESGRRRLDRKAISDDLGRWLRLIAGAWLAVATAAFLSAALSGGIPRSPTRGDWELLAQLGLLGLVAIGGGLAFRWTGIGATIVTLGAIGLGVLASLDHRPERALLVALVFYVPGLLLWLDWQRTKPPWELAVLAATLLLALGGGGYGSYRIYETHFGPVQPESPLVATPVDLVEWIWSGGVTADGIQVTAKLATTSPGAQLLISRGPDLVDPIVAEPMATSGPILRFAVGGLAADSDYWYAVAIDGRVDRSPPAHVRTFPTGPASFTFAFGSCSTTGSNGAVYDTIRAADPLFFLVTGDFFYEDIDVDDPSPFYAAFNRNLTSPAQAALHRRVPITYVWDDHDYGTNNADRASRSRPAAQQVYREVVPHYPLADASQGPIYQAFSVGRVRFILTDLRSARSPSTAPDDEQKTMMGEEQKEWFKQELVDANGVYPLIVWVGSVPWIGEASDGGDSWTGYATERRELADFIVRNSIRGLVMLSGDAHMLAIDDGRNSDYSSTEDGGFPVVQAGALDRHGSVKGGPYSEGTYPGGGQFGLFTVVDDGGPVVEVVLSGRNWKGEEIIAYRFTVMVAADWARDDTPYGDC